MKYIKSTDLDYNNTFFHFSRIDSRESIEKNGLQAVAGGENEAGNDKNNKTIYFSKGIRGVFKAVDVWARWEYDRYANNLNKQEHKLNYGYEGYDKDIMKNQIYNKLYEDFKNRQYYKVDFKEGKDGDFEYGDIDVKKIISRDKYGVPYPGSIWKYGPYSDFGTTEKPNNTQEEWNMNTKIGNRIISKDRLQIIETANGRSDALSFILEAYDKYRQKLPEKYNEMFEIFDNFITYAKEKYIEDKDFQKGSPDLGRRKINPLMQEKYQEINKIKKPSLKDELKDISSDTILINETEKEMENQNKQIQQEKNSKIKY